jgi:Ca-activated chloride channel homolog
VSIAHPWFLVLLAPAAALLWLRRPPGEGRYPAVATALRAAALIALVLALAQPSLSGRAPTPGVVVLDGSHSITAADRRVESRLLRAGDRHTPAGVAGWQVSFAGAASAAGIHQAAAAAPDTGATDLAGGLALAEALLPAGGRVTLATDGRATRGDTLEAAAALRARGVRVDVLPLAGAARSDVALTRLAAPATARQGDTVPLEITVRSDAARTADLSVRVDGKSIGTRSVALATGDTPLLVTLRGGKPGWHRYHVSIAAAADSRADDNARDAVVHVAGAPSVLVAGRAGAPGAIVGLLRSAGDDVRTVPAGQLTPAALAGADTIVLDDVPVSSLPSGSVAALTTAVRDGGAGLLVLGGPHSLTLGGYSKSPIDRLLPVRSVAPGQEPRALAIVLVLDRSGSMINLAGGVPKLRMAQAAAKVAADYVAQHDDELALVSFDTDTHVLVPLQSLDDAATRTAADQAISHLQAAGGTDIYAGLQAGLKQALLSKAVSTHIILMTDGVSAPANYPPLVARMRKANITLSTVALGNGADKPLLKNLAGAGGGRYAFTADARQLPRIFAREVQRSLGASKVVGKLSVSAAATSPLTRSLAGKQAPELNGLVATTLRSGASAPLVTHEHARTDPVLAQWQTGLGRVAVFTPGAGAWGAGFVSKDPALFDDTVRWAAAPPEPPALEPALAVRDDGRLVVQVDPLRTADRQLDLAQLTGTVTLGATRTTLAFEQVAPSRYQAVLPDGARGVADVFVADPAGAVPAAEGQLAVPPPAEDVPGPPDRALLSAVAGITGGRVLSGVGQASWPGGGPHHLWWPLVLAGLLLVTADALVRLLTPAPPRTDRAGLGERQVTERDSGGQDARVDERAG